MLMPNGRIAKTCCDTCEHKTLSHVKTYSIRTTDQTFLLNRCKQFEIYFCVLSCLGSLALLESSLLFISLKTYIL